ncbi:MAG: ABC transporter permease [Luteolibacter sp.]
MYWNAFIIALREIRRNLTRAFLTVIGIVIGVAAVITMVTLGQGATETVKSQISGLGSNLLVLRPGQGWRAPAGTPQFSLVDMNLIQEQVPGVQAVAPVIETNVPTAYLEESRTGKVTGSHPEYFTIGNWKLADGRFFDDKEVTEGSTVCVIGQTVKRELFQGRNPIGQRIRVKNTSMVVIGLLAAKGQAGFGNDQDDNIIIPITTLQRRLTGKLNKQSISQIMISGKDGYDSTTISDNVSSLMRERRGIRGTEQDNFMIVDTREIADAVSSSTKVMTSLLGAVAGVSLLVGGIGIMNIMLVSVTERTREIGIRLAIGARAYEVLLQFLIEAVTLSCVGGVAGVLLAYALCVNLAKVVGAPFLFDPQINITAVIFSAAIGILFGFMPARRAAKLDPIDALRHE